MNQHNEMPRLWGLTTLATILHWCEEAINTLSGPLLVVGLGIALVDLLTDGGLTTSVPLLLYVWAVSQAVGVDAQLVGSFARARHAARTGRWPHLVGLLALGCVLAYVGWIAAEVFATEQAQHITTAAALARLGMDQTSWIIQRAGLAVFLVALSGWTRYVAPPKDSAALAENERARLEREAEMEPLRQRVRAQKALGAVGLGRQVLAAARGKHVPEDEPPTGPGTPVVAPGAAGGTHPPAEADGDSGNVTQLPTPRPVRRQAARGRSYARRVRTPRPGATDPVEQKARSVWHPGMSVTQLERAAGISRSAAGKYRRTFMAEMAQDDSSDAAGGQLAR